MKCDSGKRIEAFVKTKREADRAQL